MRVPHWFFSLLILSIAVAAVGGQEPQASTDRTPITERLIGDLINPRGVAIQPETNRVFVADAGSGRVFEWREGKSRDVVVGFPPQADAPPATTAGTIESFGFLSKELFVIGTTADSGMPELRLYRWSGAEDAQPLDHQSWTARSRPDGVESKPQKVEEKTNSAGETSQTTDQESAPPGNSSNSSQPPVTPTEAVGSATSSTAKTEPKDHAADTELRGPCQNLSVSGQQLFFVVHDPTGAQVVATCLLNGEALSKVERKKALEPSQVPAGGPGAFPELASANTVGIMLSPEQFYLVAGNHLQSQRAVLSFYDKSFKHKATFAGESAPLGHLTFGPKRGRLFAIQGSQSAESPGALVKITNDPNIPDGLRCHRILPLHHPRAICFDSQSNLLVLQQSSDQTPGNVRYELIKITKLELPPSATNTASPQPNQASSESGETTVID